MIDNFEQFVKDKTAHEFFITGVAGTGKTTCLRELIEWCIDNRIPTVTCAYTHKAVSVLRSKLPSANNYHTMCTLHSYLKKRPTINTAATKLNQVDGNSSAGAITKAQILFIDEFSMIGEKDYVDIADLQYDEEGELNLKVVYIGDPNQLPPVKDAQTIHPRGKYIERLTKIYRQADDSKLLDILISLNDYINGTPAEGLQSNEDFIRDQNIIELYKKDNGSKIMLAYTNMQVELLNVQVEGKSEPDKGDEIFSPTSRMLYEVEAIEKEVDNIITITNQLLELDSKYKTLETLHTIEDIKFYTVLDSDGHMSQRAGVFGHNTYLTVQKELANKAVYFNNQIETEFGMNSKDWSRANWQHPLAKSRAEAWKKYLAFKDCVFCFDFKHAMTIHKSQGSTYDNVYLDMQDIGKCADRDYQMYLRLLYVAISRAAKKVYTN